MATLAFSSKKNERPVLSLFIWLKDCWMDWSQLIRQWQEALLLAQWPTPTKERNHQQNSRCPQIDFRMRFKPRRCHSKPAVSHCVTFTWPKHLNSAKIRHLRPACRCYWRQANTLCSLWFISQFPDSLKRCNTRVRYLENREVSSEMFEKENPQVSWGEVNWRHRRMNFWLPQPGRSAPHRLVCFSLILCFEH